MSPAASSPVNVRFTSEFKRSLHLYHNPAMSTVNRPYFLWDYDLTESDVHTLLQTGDNETRVWLVSRILESARYEDVWRYLGLAELHTLFPHIKLKQPVREAWAFALDVWETRSLHGR